MPRRPRAARLSGRTCLALAQARNLLALQRLGAHRPHARSGLIIPASDVVTGRRNEGKDPWYSAPTLDLRCNAAYSGYSLARMPYEIVLAPSAADDLRHLEAKVRSAVLAAMEIHLRHEPTKVSRSRIKRLRGMRRPQYRLRVNDIRVFYDVTDDVVEVLAIMSKEHANEWLAAEGDTDEGSSSIGGEG